MFCSQDLKPSNIVVKTDCTLKVRFTASLVYQQNLTTCRRGLVDLVYDGDVLAWIFGEIDQVYFCLQANGAGMTYATVVQETLGAGQGSLSHGIVRCIVMMEKNVGCIIRPCGNTASNNNASVILMAKALLVCLHRRSRLDCNIGSCIYTVMIVDKTFKVHLLEQYLSWTRIWSHRLLLCHCRS